MACGFPADQSKLTQVKFQLGMSADWKSLRGTADTVRIRNDSDILRQALHTWIVSERGKLLRTVLDTRILQTSVGNWKRAGQRLLNLEGTSPFDGCFEER